jgi:hypothetical protein
MSLCVRRRPVEMFGIIRQLPKTIVLVAGNVVSNVLLEPVHDETIISIFKIMGKELEVTFDQFFMGCAEPAQRWPSRRIIGFVRQADGVWTYSRRLGRFEADAPGEVHRQRSFGDIVLSPAFQPNFALV